MYGLPVSTTHVLSSGVAGDYGANRSGFNGIPLRNMAMVGSYLAGFNHAFGPLYWGFPSIAERA